MKQADPLIGCLLDVVIRPAARATVIGAFIAVSQLTGSAWCWALADTSVFISSASCVQKEKVCNKLTLCMDISILVCMIIKMTVGCIMVINMGYIMNHVDC